MVCGLCATCPIHSCYFAMHLPNPAGSVWRFNSSTVNYAQEHVPVDPASSASIQIPHDVVRIAFAKAPIAFGDAGAGLPPVPLLAWPPCQWRCGPLGGGKIWKITWKILENVVSNFTSRIRLISPHSIVSGRFRLFQGVSGNRKVELPRGELGNSEKEISSRSQ